MARVDDGVVVVNNDGDDDGSSKISSSSSSQTLTYVKSLGGSVTNAVDDDTVV